MATFNTEAIVLYKRPLWEADRLYILYTKDYGRIEAAVKSAAFSKSKLAGSLEPVCLVQTMIAKGRQRETLAGVQLLRHYQFNDWQTLRQVALVRELFLKLIKSGVSEPELYQKLLAYLDFQEQPHNLLTKSFMTQRFVWQTLEILGHLSRDFKNLSGRLKNFSPKSRRLLDACLTELPVSLQISDNLVQELEKLTLDYLREIMESDLNSFYLTNSYG